MKKKAASLLLLAAGFAGALSAQEKDVPNGIPRLDHVFVIVMENHGYQQIVGNPNEPYLNNLIKDGKVNLATKYFAVGHPSLTNYLEIVGGSNFGVRSDNAPNWGSKTCTPNLQSGLINAQLRTNWCVPARAGRATRKACRSAQSLALITATGLQPT